MNIIVNSDRTVEKEYTEKDGSQNENRVTELNFTLPEEYSGEGFVTKIAFITEDGNFSDYIENGTYILKNNITKYREVVCFVWLTESVNNIDFRSQTFKLDFYYNEDPSNYIPSEQEKSQIELLIEELDALIARVEALPSMSKQIVEELPTENIDPTVIYMVLREDSEPNNIYDEWLYIDDDWEKIGSTQVDLSDYYNKTQTNSLLNAKQNTIDSSHKLDADLVDDTSTTHKFTSTSEKNSWNAKYNKPSGGIPKTDLASDVQTSLGKADTAVQDVSGKEDKTNKTSIIDENSTNTQYAGAKAVYDNLVLRDEEISDLKTKNELLVKDHVPIENTGTELQLTGTGDLPMELVPYGNISQETTTGKNLFNYIDNLRTPQKGLTSAINSDGSITTTGIPTIDYVNIISYIIDDILESGQTYVLSQKDRQDNLLYLQINATNKSTSVVTYYSLYDKSSQSFTADTENYTYRLSLQTRLITDWGSSSRTITNYYMLEKGSTATEFEKYTGGQASPNVDFPSPVKVVDGEYEIYSSRSLPNEYQEVEYISSTSARTQYIDLNRITNKDNVKIFKIKTSIQWNSINVLQQYLGGNGGSFLGTATGTYNFGTVSTNIVPSTNKFDDIKFEINYNTRNIKYSINGVQNQGTRANDPADYKIAIFGLFNSSQQIDFMCDCKIKYFTIYEDNNIIFNLIPCYRKSDNVIGMYDLVNGVFYTNAGTGSFNKGQNQNIIYIDNFNNKTDIDTSPNPLYSENDSYKYLTSEQATALGLNTGAGWYVYNEWGEEIFDGSENYEMGSENNYYYFYKARPNNSIPASVCLSQYFKHNSNYARYDSSMYIGNNNIIFSRILENGSYIETVNDFKNWLSTHNTKVFYSLATPTYTKITNTTLIASLEALKDMQSYYDITNINQSHNSAQADMKIQANALKSLKAMQSETDTLLNAKVDKSSFVYDSNTETLSITIS